MQTPSCEEQLFADVLARPAHERGAFLDGACHGDAARRARIDALLAAHEGPESLMVPPVPRRPIVSPEEKPGDWIGRYKLLQQIGEGGCGVVWMAEQEEPVRRRVALKVIKLGMDTKAVVARFEAERQALAMMDHPNIAKVLDGGATDSGRPYFVMELVRGIRITRFCDDNKLSTKARLELFIQVCHAIQHAHQKGIIHRDIKPSNILVTLHDETAVPMVIDFGIAKATQGRLTDQTLFTAFEQFIGTPVYMSPEQAEYNALDVDTRSDIYSLGVLLYELLTGRPPFDPKTLTVAGLDQVRKIIREAEPPRPSTRVRTLTDEERTTIAKTRAITPAQLSTLLRGDLDWIVMKALEKNRVRRYQTANAFALDVQRYLANEPVVARPPSAAYRIRKFATRHKAGFLAGSVVAVSLLAAATFSFVSLLSEKAARERAIAAEQSERLGRQRAEVAEAAARKSEQLATNGRINAETLLSFVFTDFGEQLNDFGQMSVLQQASERAIAYYERQPVELQTRESRAAYAFALAGVSAALGWFPPNSAAGTSWNNAATKSRLERATQIFEELQSSGPLTPFMRVAFAATAIAISEKLNEDYRFDDALTVCERAEQVLRPALGDADWGGWAQRTLTKLITWRGWYLRISGRAGSAVPETERALVSASEADRRPPITTRPGLRAAMIRADLADALFLSGRRDEARQASARARAELREFIDREPSLASARWFLAWASSLASRHAGLRWKFDELLSVRKEALAEYGELSKMVPQNPVYQGEYAYLWSHGASVTGHAWLVGNFAAAEADAQRAVDLLSMPWVSPRWRRNLPVDRLNLARIYAASSKNSEVNLQLDEAEKTEQRLVEELRLPDLPRELRWVDQLQRRRLVEFHRLNWPAMRRNAEDFLRRLESLDVGKASEASFKTARRVAHRDMMRAAFEAGDYATARRELELGVSTIAALPVSVDIQQRFDRLGDQLMHIHVRARGGDRELAQTELRALWTEVDDIFAAGPDYLFNQVQTARALSIRAEIDGDVTAKRGWLGRAADYLLPAAAAGNLTRYEREVLLAGIEKQLAALPPN